MASASRGLAHPDGYLTPTTPNGQSDGGKRISEGAARPFSTGQHAYEDITGSGNSDQLKYSMVGDPDYAYNSGSTVSHAQLLYRKRLNPLYEAADTERRPLVPPGSATLPCCCYAILFLIAALAGLALAISIVAISKNYREFIPVELKCPCSLEPNSTFAALESFGQRLKNYESAMLDRDDTITRLRSKMDAYEESTDRLIRELTSRIVSLENRGTPNSSVATHPTDLSNCWHNVTRSESHVSQNSAASFFDQSFLKDRVIVGASCNVLGGTEAFLNSSENTPYFCSCGGNNSSLPRPADLDQGVRRCILHLWSCPVRYYSTR